MKKNKNTALIIAFAAGICYYIIIRLTGFTISCPIHKLTGYYCPGCGISHIFIDLGNLDFLSAVRENLYIDIMLVVWIPIMLLRKFRPSPAIAPSGRFDRILCLICISGAVIFAVLRNLPSFDFLLPLYAR